MSSTASSYEDEITFPTSSASVSGTVTSYSTTEGDDQSDGNGNRDSRSTNGMDNDESPPSANKNDDDDDDSDDESDDFKDGSDFRRTHGSCEFYPSISNDCQVLRSCYDCLNYNVSSEPHGCMVNTIGVCSRRSAYNPALDYRLGRAANDASSISSGSGGSSSGNGGATVAYDEHQFLAGAATYCDLDDRQCAACIGNQFSAVIFRHSDTARSQFCYGENGCVCIAVCEARRIHPPPLDKSCIVNAMSANEQDRGADYGSAFVIAGAMVMAVIVVLAIYRIRKRGESVASDSDGSNSLLSASHRTSDGDDDDGGHNHLVITPGHDASPVAMAVAVPMPTRSSSLLSAGKGSILLNLFNWNAIREVLVQHEQLRREGIDMSSLPADTTGVDADGVPTKGDVQFLGVEPSAPDMDDEKPTAPAVPVAAEPSAPVVWTVRAMAGPGSPSAPSAPDFDALDDEDVHQALRAL